MRGGDTLKQLIGSALVDGQIVRLTEEENETTFAIVTRVFTRIHDTRPARGEEGWAVVASSFERVSSRNRAVLILISIRMSD
jgi:hypothetical protein